MSEKEIEMMRKEFSKMDELEEQVSEKNQKLTDMKNF